MLHNSMWTKIKRTNSFVIISILCIWCIHKSRSDLDSSIKFLMNNNIKCNYSGLFISCFLQGIFFSDSHLNNIPLPFNQRNLNGGFLQVFAKAVRMLYVLLNLFSFCLKDFNATPLKILFLKYISTLWGKIKNIIMCLYAVQYKSKQI